MLTLSKPPVYQTVEPYKYFNYTTLHCRGIGKDEFDMMRYDRAFFARRKDVDVIQSLIGKDMDHVLHPFSLLLCKYDWKGMTRPNWTPEKLCGGQEYVNITDPGSLYELGANHTELRPSKGLKVKTEQEVTGLLKEVLDVMYNNRAMPNTEVDSGILGQAFYKPEEPITVTLCNFSAQELLWLVPVTAL